MPNFVVVTILDLFQISVWTVDSDIKKCLVTISDCLRNRFTFAADSFMFSSWFLGEFRCIVTIINTILQLIVVSVGFFFYYNSMKRSERLVGSRPIIGASHPCEGPDRKSRGRKRFNRETASRRG